MTQEIPRLFEAPRQQPRTKTKYGLYYTKTSITLIVITIVSVSLISARRQVIVLFAIEAPETCLGPITEGVLYTIC